MNHCGGDLKCGLAGNENDAAPIVFEHAGQIVGEEADAGEDVDLEESQPVGIGDFGAGVRLEDSQIVDQNVGVRDLLCEGLDARGGA